MHRNRSAAFYSCARAVPVFAARQDLPRSLRRRAVLPFRVATEDLHDPGALAACVILHLLQHREQLGKFRLRRGLRIKSQDLPSAPRTSVQMPLPSSDSILNNT